MFQKKGYVKSKQAFYVCSIISFENRVVCRIMWTNIVERDRPQMTMWCMRISCWVTKALSISNTYCLSTAIMVAGMKLDVTLYVYLDILLGAS